MAEMVIRGAINNDLRMVMRNVTPRNVRIKDSRQFEEPIYYAVGHGNREMINLLHNNGASLNYQTRRGHSLAYVAASHGHDDLARTLARHGGGTVADINAAVKQRNQQIAYNKKKAADDRKMTIINNKKNTDNSSDIYNQDPLEAAIWDIGARIIGGGGRGTCGMCGMPSADSSGLCSVHVNAR